MSHSVTYEAAALNSAAGFLNDDPAGLGAVLDATDALTVDPRPGSSAPLGSADLRRLRVGRYRVVYRIEDDQVVVIHIGRTAF